MLQSTAGACAMEASPRVARAVRVQLLAQASKAPVDAQFSLLVSTGWTPAWAVLGDWAAPLTIKTSSGESKARAGAKMETVKACKRSELRMLIRRAAAGHRPRLGRLAEHIRRLPVLYLGQGCAAAVAQLQGEALRVSHLCCHQQRPVKVLNVCMWRSAVYRSNRSSQSSQACICCGCCVQRSSLWSVLWHASLAEHHAYAQSQIMRPTADHP